ncbi:MAG TPA: hypothetical protein VFU25_06230 [Ornithinibacter sp.]|jgi:hypothetical protein|nr:hypothetical protein [Ornithinibacter sp.]
MNTNSIAETIAIIAALGGLAAPVAYLMERTHRRDRREHGIRTTWTWTRHDADTRRIADELSAFTGAAHR